MSFNFVSNIVIKCSVLGCTNVFGLKNGISFFKFPENEEMKRKWLEVVPVENIDKLTRVCSQHFKPEEIRIKPNTEKQYLLPKAVPSIQILPQIIKVESSISRPVSNPSSLYMVVNPLDLDSPPHPITSSGPSLKIGNSKHTSSVAVQTDKVSPRVDELRKRKIKTLLQRLKRRELKIKRLTEIVKHHSCFTKKPLKNEVKN